MENFHNDVELAIDLAAHDVAKVLSDIYGGDFMSVRRNIASMIRMGCRGSKGQQHWVSSAKEGAWLVNAADPGAVDRDALSRAIPKWWDSLDGNRQLQVIMGPAGHHKSEYINSILQKYQDKPESNLAKDLPDLQQFYSKEVGAAPAAPEQEVVPEPAESSLKKSAAGGETRFDGNGWIQAWMSFEELQDHPGIQELKSSNADVRMKVEKAKEIALGLAYDKVNRLSGTNAVEIDFDTLKLDSRNDKIDWDALVSNQAPEEEV